jgi:hypothetical protein
MLGRGVKKSNIKMQLVELGLTVDWIGIWIRTSGELL